MIDSKAKVGRLELVGKIEDVKINKDATRPDKKATIEVRTIGDTIYITKYQDGQIGERSVGMTAKSARAVAELFLACEGEEIAKISQAA